MIPLLREWISKAENDLTAAACVLKMGKEAPTDTVCYHAQQCVEKYCKALLTYRSIAFPKTHKIAELLLLMDAADRPKLAKAIQDRLTDYATVMRYPGGGPDITVSEARQAVATARRVRKEVRRLLPRAALRRK